MFVLCVVSGVVLGSNLLEPLGTRKPPVFTAETTMVTEG